MLRTALRVALVALAMAPYVFPQSQDPAARFTGNWTGTQRLKTPTPSALAREDQAVSLSIGVTDAKIHGVMTPFLGSEEGELKDAKIKFKLKEVKEVDKKRCAILTGKLEAKGTAEGDMTFTANLDLDLVIWLDRGYLLSAKGKGKVTIKGDNDQMTISGEGPMTMDLTSKVE